MTKDILRAILHVGKVGFLCHEGFVMHLYVYKRKGVIMEKVISAVIAVSVTELNQFGCPHCGYRSGSTPLSFGGAASWRCGSNECGKTSCILAEGLTKSPIGFGDFYPALQDHPRRGIPSHGNLDKRPSPFSEYFRSRGIGLDACTCFVCGTNDRTGRESGYLHNIAAFVQCKEAGERVVAMFAQGAKLDYRVFEPDRVQVKIGACDKHLTNLQKLDELTKDGVITAEMIKVAAV